MGTFHGQRASLAPSLPLLLLALLSAGGVAVPHQHRHLDGPVKFLAPGNLTDFLPKDLLVEKKLVILCNAYPNHEPVNVRVSAVRKGTHQIGTAALKATTFWKRSLDYGACEEYNIDLRHHQFGWVPPGNNSVACLLNPIMTPSEDLVFQRRNSFTGDDLGVMAVEAGLKSRLVVVLTQPNEDSPECVASPVILPDPNPDASHAELVILDTLALTSDSERDEDKEEEEVELDKRDAENGLKPLPPLDGGATIRLEDKIENYVIASEAIGSSQLLNFGRIYAVEPKEFHVALEDLRGTHLLDNKDMNFKAGHTYIGLRIGRKRDKAFPQKLALYPCNDGSPFEEFQ